MQDLDKSSQDRRKARSLRGARHPSFLQIRPSCWGLKLVCPLALCQTRSSSVLQCRSAFEPHRQFKATSWVEGQAACLPQSTNVGGEKQRKDAYTARVAPSLGRNMQAVSGKEQNHTRGNRSGTHSPPGRLPGGVDASSRRTTTTNVHSVPHFRLVRAQTRYD
jgi:hypothetical protein